MTTISDMQEQPWWSTDLPGKFVGENLYLHVSAIGSLPPPLIQKVLQASKLATIDLERDYNVIKLSKNSEELSLLSYPHFYEEGFPTLARSWRISLARSTVVFRTYEESRNPPILHRKELLLSSDDPLVPIFNALTAAAESLGLFEDVARIGTREYWFALIAERGYELVGHDLLPIANALTPPTFNIVEEQEIQRHLTALSRGNFSAPVQALWRHGLINPERHFFDYGCGRGDDVRGLLANGIDASGWDPHYAAAEEKRIADTVNIGFVINVIEDFAERVQALQGAYACTAGVLSVAAMLSSQAPPDGRAYRDGYLSSRKTFQKYYTQTQLRDFIEGTLDEPAIAVGPGIFFVFRDKALEQRFLTQRYGRQAKNVLLRGWTYEHVRREARPPRPERVVRVKVDREMVMFEAHQETFSLLWLKSLELGRYPEPSELDQEFRAAIDTHIGSLNKALRVMSKRFNAEDLEHSAKQKRSNLLVFAALQQFQKRQPYKHLDEVIQRDIRYFFGDYSSLLSASRGLLYDIAEVEKLDAACREAAEKGYGWLEDSHSLQVHVHFLERLPVLLRVYAGCATLVYGDIAEFELIKIHIRSGKITLMKFDDFMGSPLPKMTERIKIKLREQDLDVFSYGEEFPPPLLYQKSRFINEEFPRFDEQVQFEEHLAKLGLHDLRGYGPSAAAFYHILGNARWAVEDFRLMRSLTIPDLDAPCGANFTYRDLIECGETQQRTGIPNLPREPETYTALHDLAIHILDPVIDYFGMVELTYGFCSAPLAKEIKGRIAPHLDQHAGHEKNARGNLICNRLGAACDFLVVDEDMEDVARWVMQNTPVDRLYYYGPARPIHVSFSSTPARQFVRLKVSKTGALIPSVDRVLSGDAALPSKS